MSNLSFDLLFWGIGIVATGITTIGMAVLLTEHCRACFMEWRSRHWRTAYKDSVFTFLYSLDRYCAYEYPEIEEIYNYLRRKNEDRDYFYGDANELREILRKKFPREKNGD